MNPLQYTSEEMYSSTELIRKSKMVFDKLHKKEIEKAIILRDGKPSFMLLDFTIYEEIMAEYLSLKEILDNQDVKVIKKDVKIVEEVIHKEIPEEKLNDEDLEKALAQIDELDLDITSINKEETKDIQKDEKEPLKEFWE